MKVFVVLALFVAAASATGLIGAPIVGGYGLGYGGLGLGYGGLGYGGLGVRTIGAPLISNVGLGYGGLGYNTLGLGYGGLGLANTKVIGSPIVGGYGLTAPLINRGVVTKTLW